jgi:hypothetical protein
VLAAILTLLQDDDQPSSTLPMVKIDRGGGGGPNVPMYLIGDYMTVLGTFREINGEHPVMRMARRTEHVQDGLRHLQGERTQKERDLAAAMLYGAQLGHTSAVEAANERVRTAEAGQAAALEAMRMNLASCKTRGTNPGGGIGIGGAVALLAFGVGIGILIARRR